MVVWGILAALSTWSVQSQALRSRDEQQTRQLATDVHTLVANFQAAKEQLHDKLRQDYGPEVFDNFFFYNDEQGKRTSAGRAYHVPASSASWWRLQRKIVTKILRHMVQGTKQPFVWASGGHSAAGMYRTVTRFGRQQEWFDYSVLFRRDAGFAGAGWMRTTAVMENESLLSSSHLTKTCLLCCCFVLSSPTNSWPRQFV